MKKIMWKKLVPAFFVIILATLLSACNAQSDAEKQSTFNVEEGKQIINHFLTAVVKHDDKSAVKYLTGNALTIYKNNFSKLSINGYQLIDAEELNNGARYHVKVFETKPSTPYYAVNDTKITMEKTTNGDYTIKDLTFTKELVAEQKGDSVVTKEGNEEKTLLSLKQLPDMANPKGNDGEFKIDKTKFACLALSPDKSFLLFATNGTHAYLGKYYLESKEITSIDLYFEGKVARINCSPDGNFYAVEKLNPTGKSNIELYDAATDEKYPFPGGGIFNKPELNITQPFFYDDNFYFQIKADNNIAANGWWLYNFKSKKIGKLLR